MIVAEPNSTYQFTDVLYTGVKVHHGMTHDRIGRYLGRVVTKALASTDIIGGILKHTRTDAWSVNQ